MKAFLIDPKTKTIQEVEYDGDYRHIYELGEFGCFEVVYFNTAGDSVFVDEEGMFKEDRHFFIIEGYPQPLAGKGVVLGCDEDGETVAPTVTLDWLLDHVHFPTVVQ